MRLTLIAALLAVAVSSGEAQTPARDAIDFGEFNTPYDGRFTFVRLRFTPSVTGFGRGGGGGFFGGYDFKWDHDYPRAERNFVRLLSELTSVRPRLGGGNILPVDDPELFRFPVAYLSEPGFWTLTPGEAASLRRYLLQGGFLIVDDFAGDFQLVNFQRRIQEVLPDGRLVRLDVSHPIFHSFFEIETLELAHPLFNVPSAFFGIFEDNDPAKRLMVIANYNNDIGESWEWSDTGFIPIEISNTAYRFGVNYMVYALTH